MNDVTKTEPLPLVERLRGRRSATRWRRGLDTDYATCWEPDALCQEAADEIERLRAEVENLKAGTVFSAAVLSPNE